MGDSKIHDMIVRASGNDLLAHNVGALRRRTLLFGRYRLSGRLRNGQAEHLAIIDAILAEDREATQSAMRTTWT